MGPGFVFRCRERKNELSQAREIGERRDRFRFGHRSAGRLPQTGAGPLSPGVTAPQVGNLPAGELPPHFNTANISEKAVL